MGAPRIERGTFRNRANLQSAALPTELCPQHRTTYLSAYIYIYPTRQIASVRLHFFLHIKSRLQRAFKLHNDWAVIWSSIYFASNLTLGLWFSWVRLKMHIWYLGLTIFAFWSIRSLNTTAMGCIDQMSMNTYVGKKKRTHVQAPTESFCPTVESIRKIRVMSIYGMKLAPYIDELWILRICRWSKYILERGRFGFGISRCFVPVFLGIAEIWDTNGPGVHK